MKEQLEVNGGEDSEDRQRDGFIESLPVTRGIVFLYMRPHHLGDALILRIKQGCMQRPSCHRGWIGSIVTEAHLGFTRISNNVRDIKALSANISI